jgi:hypothetical protein
MGIKKFYHTTYAIQCEHCGTTRLDVEHDEVKEDIKCAEAEGWEYVEKTMDGYRFICPNCIKAGKFI